MSDIPTELSLDITSALAAIAQIDAALEAAATNFQSAIDSSLSSLDIPAVDVPVEVDTTGAADLESTLESAAGGVTVPVAADTADAQEAIGSLEGDTIVVGVEADTSGAQADLAALGGQAQSTGADLAQFGANARAGFDAAGAALQGNLAGVSGALGKFGPQAAGVGAAIVTLAGAEKLLVGNALEAEAAQQRFNDTLGVSAAAVERIDIGGLNADLSELVLSLGSSDEGAKQAAASIFQLGVSAGESRGDVAATTEEILALAARAVALKPSLGEVGDVAERLTTGLARGGRFASQFSISLTQADITAEALRQNVGKTADELTLYDKAAAGATLATQRLGGSLSTDIARGSQNIQIQFAAVRESFNETLEAAGKPLLEPTIEALEDAQPAVEALAEAFSAVLQVVLPFANALLNSLKPALEAITPLIDIVAKGAGLIGKAFELSTKPLELGVSAVSGLFGRLRGDTKQSADEVAKNSEIVASAVNTITDALGAIPRGLAGAEEIGAAFDEVTSSIGPVTAQEAELRAETTRLAVALSNGTATAQQFRRVFSQSGLDIGTFTDSVDQIIAERDRLAASFQAGLPSIGDAFKVEAAKTSAAAKTIDRSFEDIVRASDELRDRFTANLPSIADAFTEGVKPEDLRDAQNTLESFIQGVEGVSKSAADAAQAVIDKAAVEGGTGLAGFLEQLRKQTQEIAAFQGTLAALRGRGASDLAASFAERGLESAAIASEAAALSDADLAAAEATVEQAKGVRADAVRNMGLFADELVATFGPKGAEAGTIFGEGLVTSLSDPAIVQQARDAAAKIGEATTQGAAEAKPQPQTLAGFLANLRAQSKDIEAFQADLNTIAAGGATVLSDTLRQQGLDAATAARQAAGLAPAQLAAAEVAVRDAQGVLAVAEADNKAAADRLVQFMADTATRAASGFTDNFVVTIGTTLGALGAEILAASPGVIAAAATLGVNVGTTIGDNIEEGLKRALEGTQTGALLGIGVGLTAQPVQVTLPAAAVQSGFGTGSIGVATAPGGAAAPAVVIENVNVTPPQGATADEQADAVAESLQWRIRGAR